MNPSARQMARIKSGAVPRWFAAPVLQADPAAYFSRSLTHLAAQSLHASVGQSALIFHVGKLEACLALLPVNQLPICSLFQWVPLELQSPSKRFIYNRILKKSRVLATYSRLSEAYLKQLFPQKPVVWLGHFTDTEFFQPIASKSSAERFMLAVGDHKRHEAVIVKLAEALRITIVRVSGDSRVTQYHTTHASPFVKMLTAIDFDELRQLYNDADLILNVADDRLWPVGITTFCEALAMNKLVITSSRHSCSGYAFEDGTKPYYTVDATQEVEAWLAAIRQAQSQGAGWETGRNPRDLAIKFCSFESMTKSWEHIHKLLMNGGCVA